MSYYREYHFSPDEVIVYLRKSRQDDPVQTVEEVLAKHRQILDDWVARNLSGRIPEENYYSERVSGETIKDRIEIKKILSQIESPRIRAVLVVEPQRLSRGDLEDAGRIINAFRYSNTTIITPNRYYDLQDEADRMFFEMELKQGNQFLEYTKKIMARGRNVSAQRGAYIANRAPLGYEKVTIDKLKTLRPNENAPIVRRIFEMYASGIGKRAICAWLDSAGVKTRDGKSWSPESVSYILKNVTYIGKIRYNATKIEKQIENGEVQKKRVRKADYIEVDGLHEPIINAELFYAVQDRIGTMPHKKASSTLINPFAGLIRCKSCGRMIGLGKTHSGEPYLYCAYRTSCRNGSVMLHCVVDSVCDALESEINRFSYAVENDATNEIEAHNELIHHLERQIEELDKKELAQWQDRYESDSPMPEHIFRKLNEDLNRQRDSLKAALNDAIKNAPQQIDYKKKIMQFQQALGGLRNDQLPAADQNELLKKCIKIMYYSREIGRTGNSYDLQKRPFSLDIEFVL